MEFNERQEHKTMRNYQEQLQFQALKDLTNRAKSGILTYITVFLAIALTYDLPNIAPEFFYINLATLLIILCSRASHYVALNSHDSNTLESHVYDTSIRASNKVAANIDPHLPTNLLQNWLIVTLLCAALHWGLMSAWIIHDETLSHLETVALIIIPAFALGGSCILCISSVIRMLYPALMFAPLIASLLYQGTAEHYLLAGLVTLSLLYIFSATRATHDDYWKAITNHIVAEERAELMEQLSTTDPLTQLKNRMYFDSEYAKEWNRCSRSNSPLSIIMVDLDFFKRINDTYGHLFGDECLRSVAQSIASETKRPGDLAARFGGEEFIVLLPDTDEAGAATIAQRILEAIPKVHLIHKGKSIKLTCSIGGATVIPGSPADKALLIQKADEALYLAKRSGRNRYQSHCEEEFLAQA